MKKFILSAVALAAFGLGGVAQADVIDSVGNTISRIFGIPYSPTPYAGMPIGTIYTDANGRQFQVDAAGRHIPLDQVGSYPPAPHGGIVAGPYAMGPHDIDGDGVANQYDRSPHDGRYR